jgi:HEAT repeat protein
MAGNSEQNPGSLIEILKSESRPLKERKAALRKLAELESREALNAIEEATNSDDEALRFYARRALKRLDGLFADRPADVSNGDSLKPNSASLTEEGAADSHSGEGSTDVDSAEAVRAHDGGEQLLSQTSAQSTAEEAFAPPPVTMPDAPAEDSLEPAARQFLDDIRGEGNIGKLVYRIQMAGELEDPSFIAPLQIFLSGSDNPQVIATILSVLGSFEDAALSGSMIPFLSHDDSRVRANAIEALGEAGNDDSIGYILPFMDDPDNRIKANAAKALWKFDESMVLKLLSDMAGSNAEGMQISAVHALGKINSDGARKILENLAAVKSAVVSTQAREQLDEIDARDRHKSDRTARLKAIIGEDENDESGSDSSSLRKSDGGGSERSSSKKSKGRSTAEHRESTGRGRKKGFFRRIIEFVAILVIIAILAGAVTYNYYPPGRLMMIAWLDQTLLSLAGIESGQSREPADAVTTQVSEVSKPSATASSSGTSAAGSTVASIPSASISQTAAPETASSAASSSVVVQTAAQKAAVAADSTQSATQINPGASGKAPAATAVVSSPPAPIAAEESVAAVSTPVASAVSPAAVSTPVSTPDSTASATSTVVQATAKTDAADTDTTADPLKPLPGLKGDVQKIYIAMSDAYNRKNIDDYMVLYDEGYSYLGNSHEIVRKVISEEFSFGPKLVMYLDSIDITVRDATARVKVSYYYSGKTETGVELDREFSLTARTDTLVKENGKWRIRHSE